MGILGETNSALSAMDAERRSSIAEQQQLAVNEALVRLAGIIEEPEFTGDPETALVHYYQEDAFGDPHMTNRYTSLVAEMNGHRGETRMPLGIGSHDLVPVLFIEDVQDEMGDHLFDKTSLVVTDTEPNDGVVLTSSRTVKKDVKMHAMTSSTADVTKRELSLVGSTVSASVDITTFEKGKRFGANTRSSGFTLAEEATAGDGHGVGMRSSYGFSDSGSEVLEREPTIVVGWDAIDKTLAKGLGRSESFEHTLQVADFVEANGACDLETFLDQTPRIKDAIHSARTLQQHLGGLSTRR